MLLFSYNPKVAMCLRPFLFLKRNFKMNTNILPDTALANMIKSPLSNISINRGWVSTSEVAYVLGVNERTVIRWRSQSLKQNKKCGVTCYHIGNQYRYLLVDIYQYYLDHIVA